MTTRFHSLAFLIVPGILTIPACGPPAPPRELSTELIAQAGGFSISADPVLDVPSTVGSQTLVNDVTGATRLSDGSIAIADGFGERIAIVDSLGGLLRYLGRTGSGPGEFRAIRWLGQCGPDTLTVWDPMASRLTVIDNAGEVISQRSFGERPLTLSCNRDGRLAVLFSPPLATDSDEHPTLYAGSLILGPSGDSVGSLGTMAVGNSKLLGALAVLAVGDAWIAYGDGSSDMLEIRDPTGAKLREVKIGTVRRTPTTAEIDAEVEKRIESVGGSRNDSVFHKMIRERIPVADRLPAYQSAHVDEHENIWLVTSARGDGVTELRVLPTTDREPATLRVAGDMSVFEVRNGFLLGRMTDTTGVPHLVVYRVGG